MHDGRPGAGIRTPGRARHARRRRALGQRRPRAAAETAGSAGTLGMNSAARETDNNFTPMRLLLALLVVLGHFQILAGVNSPPWPFVYAGAAVDCFFVVSGYLVSYSFDRDRDLMRFYIRRFFRIY